MEILLFGITRDIIGETVLRLPADAEVHDVASLRRWLAAEYPRLAGLRSLAIAVDNEYAADEQPLSEAREIALIPPVSGG